LISVRTFGIKTPIIINVEFLNFDKGKIYLEEDNTLVVDLDDNITVTDNDVSKFVHIYKQITNDISGKIYLLILLQNISIIKKSAFLIGRLLPAFKNLGANAFVIKTPLENSIIRLYIDVLKSPDKKSMLFIGEEDARIWLKYRMGILGE